MDNEQTEQTPNFKLLVYPSQNSEMLVRADNGMIIGQRQNRTVVYGEDPNKKQGRLFMEDEYAKAYLCGFVAEQSLKDRGITEPVVIEKIDKEPIIQPAGEYVSLPGGMRPIN